MDFVSGVVVYLLLWWWVFLMSLPFGVRIEDNPEAGHATSAPARPMLWRKMGVTTVIAAVLTAVIHWIISSEIISLGIVGGGRRGYVYAFTNRSHKKSKAIALLF